MYSSKRDNLKKQDRKASISRLENTNPAEIEISHQERINWGSGWIQGARSNSRWRE